MVSHPESLGQWIEERARMSRDRVALTDPVKDSTWTYSNLLAWVDYWTQTLAHRDVTVGDRVALATGQHPLHSVALLLACGRLGAMLAPLNWRLSEKEQSDILADLAPKVTLNPEDLPSAHTLVPGPSSISLPDRDPTRPWLLLTTSGTTGKPKGVLLSERALYWNAQNTQARLELSASDSTCTFLPLFHTGAWNVFTLPLLMQGGRIDFFSKFEATTLVHHFQKHPPTQLMGVPTVFKLLADQPHASDALSKLKTIVVGGEPMPLSLIERYENWGIRVRQGYGLTEYGPSVFSLDAAKTREKMGSVGTPNPTVQVSVRNEDGSECAPNQTGELWLKGPSACSGYWKRETESRELFGGHEPSDSHWLRTGDLVRVDPDGFVFVEGRLKDMYISGGENVYPAEVERAIRELPNVQDVAVIGIPHSRWGESGAAFIVPLPLPGTQQGPHSPRQWIQEIQSLLETRLAKYKQPSEWHVISALPVQDNGKVNRKALRDLLKGV